MCKVLLIDDDPDVLELLRYQFAGAGYQVTTATDGMSGLREARQITPQLIILDLLLPDLDGMSLCEILRKQPATARIPVLIFTAVEGQICRLASLEAGADDFATKLTRPRDLLIRAQSLLRKRSEAVQASPGSAV